MDLRSLLFYGFSFLEAAGCSDRSSEDFPNITVDISENAFPMNAGTVKVKGMFFDSIFLVNTSGGSPFGQQRPNFMLYLLVYIYT